MNKYGTIIEARICKVRVIPIIGNGNDIGKVKGSASIVAQDRAPSGGTPELFGVSFQFENPFQAGKWLFDAIQAHGVMKGNGVGMGAIVPSQKWILLKTPEGCWRIK